MFTPSISISFGSQAKVISGFFRRICAKNMLNNPPDILILIYVGSLGIAAKLLAQLFPEVPVVVIGLTEEKVATDQLGSLVTGFAQQVDPRTTIEMLLRLQPETQRIVVIGGTAEVDRLVLDRAEQAGALIHWSSRIRIVEQTRDGRDAPVCHLATARKPCCCSPGCIATGRANLLFPRARLKSLPNPPMFPFMFSMTRRWAVLWWTLDCWESRPASLPAVF
jgi:hypothetical protein